jgi:hypothetical protein
MAKDACGIPPAQVALSSANALLTLIRVSFPLLYEDELPAHVYPGHDVQQSGLRRAWADVR